MRVLLTSCLILLGVGVVGAAPDTYTKQAARRFVLDDYCANDCYGYHRTHSPRYRRIFARALDGDLRALRRVCHDRDFHSGDNEWWEEVPGHLLFVVGDERFARFLSGLPADERYTALIYLPIAAPFHNAYLRGERDYFAKNFPKTYGFYHVVFP